MKFYRPAQVLTYNRLVNMIVGDRGVGKTFAITELCIDEGLRIQDEAFMWVRRYKADLANLKNSWWKDVQDVLPKYKGIEFSCKGNVIYAKRQKGPAFPIGSLVPLTEYQRWKSIPHPHCHISVFDEFQTEGDVKYLPNELNMWLSLIDSFMRLKTGYKIFMLSNKNSMANPYFEWLGVKGNDLEKRFVSGEYWVIENTECEEYREAHRKSDFAKLVEGTRYGDYSIESRFFLDDLTDVTATPPKGAREPLWNMRIGDLLIKFEDVGGLLWVSRARDEDYVTYAYYPQDAKKYAIPLSDKRAYPTRYVVDSFVQGKCEFSDLAVKNATLLMVRDIYKGF